MTNWSPDFSYKDYKAVVWVSLTVFGSAIIAIAWHSVKLATHSVDPAFFIVPSIILLLAGLTAIYFGIQFFIFEDDPDIWQ